VDIDWIHPPSGPDAEGGSLNLCFNALDRHVVRGLADEPAVVGDPAPTYARLLEEVGAFGGVLRAFGVGPGSTVVARVPWGDRALVALLASTRVGAVHVVEEPEASAPGTVTVLGEAGPRAVIHVGGPQQPVPTDGPEALDWDVVMRAGRADPAACEEVAATSVVVVLGERGVTALDILSGDDAHPLLDAVHTLAAGRTVTWAEL